MSSRWLITDDEDAELQGTTAEAQVIYMRVIRRHMDFATGVSAVTYGQMKAVIEYIPDKGSQLPARRVKDISNHYIRARLAELERQGLIEPLDKQSRFDAPSFRCLLAPAGEVRVNQEPQRNRKDGTARGTTSEPLDVARVSGEWAASGTANEPQGMNRKISGYPVENTNNPFPNDDSSTPNPRANDRVDAGQMAVVLRQHGVNAMSTHPTVLAWATDGYTPAQVLEAVELARLSKPPPQRIPVNYLDRILRDQHAAQATTTVAGGLGHAADRKRRKSGAELIDEACAGAFMRSPPAGRA